MSKSIKAKKIIPYLLSFFSLLFFWEILSLKISSDLILPSPFSVIKNCNKLIYDSVFWLHFLLTFLRCLCSFVISLALGMILGIAGGKSKFFNYFLQLPLAIVRSTPVIAIILISIYWLSSNTLPIFISIIMNLPIVITAVISGFENVDLDIQNMAKIYNFSKWKQLIYIQLPACKNNIASAIISVYGLCWKVVVAGEVLCLPKKGLGSILQKSQIHLETANVLSITILFVIFSWLIELLIRGFLEKSWKK